jgi:hypothetical protein
MPDAKSGSGCLNIIGGLIVLVVVIGAWRTCHASKQEASATVNQQTTTVTPHEQRLTELQEKRDGLLTSAAIEREVAEKLSRDAMDLSSRPTPDPEERQYLMESMDKEKQRMAQLAEEIKAVDAEIAKEQSGGNLPPTPELPPSDQEPTPTPPPNQ